MNKKFFTGLVAAVSLCASTVSFAALNDLDKGYMDQILKGGPDTLGQVAQNMFNTAYTNQEVLDVLAQTLLEKYPMAGDGRTLVESSAWMCRALGASHNNRYRPLLEQISKDKTAHRKLRGYCEKSAKELPKGSTNTYVAGSVNLELLRNPPPPPSPPAPAAKGKKGTKNAKAAPAAQAAPSAAAAPAPAPAPAADAPKKVDFSLVQVGMSQQQVDSLLGPPTGQTQHMTGKQWQPFNYGAKDLQRMLYLYKGVGRIEFSLKSGYEGVFRVLTITPNTGETGYP
jgi:hypothetical protein